MSAADISPAERHLDWKGQFGRFFGRGKESLAREKGRDEGDLGAWASGVIGRPRHPGESGVGLMSKLSKSAVDEQHFQCTQELESASCGILSVLI